jgi:hypothetical protein
LRGILAWLRAVALWPFRLLARLLAPPRRLLARLLAPPRRLLARLLAPPRRLVSRIVAWVRRLLSRLIDPLRPLGRAIWNVVGIGAALLGGLGEILWRGMLLIAGAAMPIGGILLALGQDDTSATLVTLAYFVGVLAVPTWFATRLLARIRPPGQVLPRRRRLATERSPNNEDLSGRADQELHSHDLVLPGEPA